MKIWKTHEDEVNPLPSLPVNEPDLPTPASPQTSEKVT
jgi:hypothetical protein